MEAVQTSSGTRRCSPRFSVIVPCLNRHQELKRALKSCLDQDFEDFEVIVIDDGSSPPLETVVSSLRDVRIRLIRNEMPQGPSKARNAGMFAAEGQYLSFLDSDDWYLPNRLSLVDGLILAHHPDPSLIFHRQLRRLSDELDPIVAPTRLPHPGERLDEYVWVCGNFVQTNAFIVRRDVARAVGFDPSCIVYEDTKFFLECWSASGSYVAIADLLSTYNDLPSSTRLSRQERGDKLVPITEFVRQSCSRRAWIAFQAYAAADLPMWRHPVQVLRALADGHSVGVSMARIVVYAMRSALGRKLADTAMHHARVCLARMRKAPTAPIAVPGTAR